MLYGSRILFGGGTGFSAHSFFGECFVQHALCLGAGLRGLEALGAGDGFRLLGLGFRV